MAAKTDRLSAYFPGLVDICLGDDGQPLYLVLADGELTLQESHKIGATEFVPPDREHFQFELPRAAEVMTHYDRDDVHLYDDVHTYLQRFSALDDQHWTVVAHYVFLTYLHDHREIDYCPYLLFFAVPERGKSRTGKSVAYVSFRGMHMGELREPRILRFTEALHGTLFLDLMDVWKKAEKSNCEDVILDRYEKGKKAARVLYPEKGPFKDTVYFDIYGPTIIATNVELHKILDTRCLPIIMPNRPGNYDNPRPELALELKERLTAWRAKHLFKPLTELAPIDGISGRLWDITKPLFQVGCHFSLESLDSLEKAIFAIADERSEMKRDTTEGRIVAILRELTRENSLDGLPKWTLKVGDILRKFNFDRQVSQHVKPQWMGRKLKSMSLRHRTVHGLSEIILTQREYATILVQYGAIDRDRAVAIASPVESLPKNIELFQGDRDVVGSGRVSQEPWDEEGEGDEEDRS